MVFAAEFPEQEQQSTLDSSLNCTETYSLDDGAIVIDIPISHHCSNAETEVAEEAAEVREAFYSVLTNSGKLKATCCCSCHSSPGLENDSSCKGTDTLTDIAFQNKTLAPLYIECGKLASPSRSSGYDCIGLQAGSPVKSTTSERICRICLDAVDHEQLIAPCQCSGSTKYAHETCLLQWFFRSKKKSCELCLGKVNVKPVGFKPVQEWRLPEKKCDFIVYLFGLYFLIMLIFTGMITWIATQGCTSPVCVTLYAVCGVALIYFVYCCGCVEYSRSYWKALVAVNRIWRIYGREESISSDDCAESPTHSEKASTPFPGSLAMRFQTPTGILSLTDSQSDSYIFRKQLSQGQVAGNPSSPAEKVVTGTDNLALEHDDQEPDVARHLSQSTPKHSSTYSADILQDVVYAQSISGSELLCAVEILGGSTPRYNGVRSPAHTTDFDVISVTEVFPHTEEIFDEERLSTGGLQCSPHVDLDTRTEGIRFSRECELRSIDVTKL